MYNLKFDIKNVIKELKQDAKIKEEGKLLRDVQEIAKIGIFVGIPESTAARDDDSGMNNATLLMIHTKGSPLRGLPARPLIEPALEAASQKIADDLAKISEALLNDNPQKARKLMETTGQDAVNIVTDWFDNPNNNWPPNTDATIKAKLRKTNKSLKKRTKLFEKYKAGEGNVNTTLVDTDALRKSITYVLGDKV